MARVEAREAGGEVVVERVSRKERRDRPKVLIQMPLSWAVLDAQEARLVGRALLDTASSIDGLEAR